jgi:hypothetical protein
VVIVMINPKLAMGFCKSKYLWVMFLILVKINNYGYLV